MRITFVRVGCELLAAVVDLLDVALGAGRADDVAGLDHPPLEPVEPLAAHALGQHRDAAAAEQPRDRDAAAAVVAGRRPHRALARRVELAASRAAARGSRRRRAPCARRSAGSGRRARPRSVASTPVSSRGSTTCSRDGDEADPVGAVVPVDPEEVQRVRLVGPDRREGLVGPTVGASSGRPAGRTSGARCRASRSRSTVRSSAVVDDLALDRFRAHGASCCRLPPTLGSAVRPDFGPFTHTRSGDLRTHFDAGSATVGLTRPAIGVVGWAS